MTRIRRAVSRGPCFIRSDPGKNCYAHLIEGIRLVVDLNTMQVIRVEEYGQWPLPLLPVHYTADRIPVFRNDIKPLTITQPEGRAFSLKAVK